MTFSSLNLRLGGLSASLEAAPLRLDSSRPDGGTFDPRFQVALLLDHLAGAGESEGSLQQILSSGRARDLRSALDQIPANMRQRLDERLNRGGRETLLSLAEEQDAELFGEGIFHWASREENADRNENAALAYEFIRHRGPDGRPVLDGIPEGLRSRASLRIDAMEGRGAVGARIEFLSRRFIHEAANPVTLIGMAAGSAVFSTARSVLLARTLTSGRGLLGARALASTGAFMAEVPAFWATTKGLNEALHPGLQSWDMRTNLRELAGLTLTLGALKLSGAAAGSLTRWAHQPNAVGQLRFAGLAGISQRLAPQVGMLGGIMIGHRLEESFGLRPHVDGATTLTDSLVLLLQFNIGGRLSREMMGERFHALTQRLDQRSQRMEAQILAGHRARLQANLENLFPGGGQGGLLLATSGRSPRRPSAPAQNPHLVLMTNGNSEGPGSGRPIVSPEPSIDTPRVAPPVPPALPARTNRNQNGNGVIVDRMEPEIGPKKMLGLLSEPVQEEILQSVSLRPGQIGRINEMHFGDGLAMALTNRIQDVLFGEASNRALPFESLPESYRQALRSADELVGVVEYLRRAENEAALQAFEAAMDPEAFSHYEPLKARLAQVLGPNFVAPQGRIASGAEVVQPNQAILSIGSGDMMGMLALYRHNIRPGGLSWRTRLFATARDPVQANEINSQGTNRSKINLRQIQINYLYDPPIEAVGPGGHRGLTQEALQRTVRLQLLNVPSDQLHKILTSEYLRNLPENAILLEVIGGFIASENLGRYREGLEEGRSLLPYQLIRRALDANQREDVSIVSGGGFIPGKFLWFGRPVRMVFASPEGPSNHSSPAAEIVARTFAGPSGSNEFLRVVTSHRQHSTELGKALKNVTTLLAGYRAAELVASQMEKGAVDVSSLAWQYDSQIKNPLFEGVMRSILRNNDEVIKTREPDYELEVADDFWRCSEISVAEVHRLLIDARGVEVMDRQALRDFILNRVVNNSKLAATRNPKRGIVQSLYSQWRLRGTPFELRQLLPMEEDGVTPKMTEEGVNSLLPMTQYYNHPSHSVERRRLPEELYEAYRAFNPDKPLVLPPRVPETVQSALRGEFLGIDAARLRRTLSQSSELAMKKLDQQLRIFDRFQQAGDRSLERTAQEFELTLRLIASMRDGEPIRVTRSPIIRPPYGNMFVIQMAGDAENSHVYRAYIRVDGQKVMDRITQLGTFLRSFREGSRLITEINVEGLDPLEHARQRAELEMTLRSILDSYQRVRPDDRLSLMLGDTRIIAESREREGPSRHYFEELGPLVERLRRSLPPGQTVTPQAVRNTGQSHGGLIENFLQSNPGWPMLLGYFGGPLNQGIKSALTRPERGTLVGIYSGDQMIDTFSVYRGRDNRPMVLNHGLMSRLKAIFPDEPVYQGINSMHFYEGMRLDTFLRDYERYATTTGNSALEYRLINLRSMPLEEALTGRVEGVNPALLRLYLEGPNPNSNRQAMFDELAPLYERPFEEVAGETSVILQRHLDPFYQENAAWIDQFPLFKLFQRRRNALAYLMRNGDSGE